MGSQNRTRLTFTFIILSQLSSVQLLSRVRLIVTLWAAARQVSLFIANSWTLPNSCSSSWWCHPTISSSVVPFSCFQSFPASGSFPISQFSSGGQSMLPILSQTVQSYLSVLFNHLSSDYFLLRIIFKNHSVASVVVKPSLFVWKIMKLISLYLFWRSFSFFLLFYFFFNSKQILLLILVSLGRYETNSKLLLWTNSKCNHLLRVC